MDGSHTHTHNTHIYKLNSVVEFHFNYLHINIAVLLEERRNIQPSSYKNVHHNLQRHLS
jgi:hypothetical protein